MGRPRGLPSYSIRQLKVGPATIAKENRDETIDQPTKGRVPISALQPQSAAVQFHELETPK